jgi:hypothetical protein
MPQEICPTPAAQLLRVHVDLFSQTCLQLVVGGGICMVHWKENYPELKWLKVQSSYHETTKPWLICPALHRPLPLVVLLHPSACLGLVPGGQSKVCPKWFASTQWVPASC